MLEIQEPPVPVVVKVVLLPEHKDLIPLTVIADGGGITKTSAVSLDVPQTFVFEHVMITEPEVIPKTVPEALTVAIEVLLLDHETPVDVSDRTMVLPTHTVVGPVISPITGVVIILIVVVSVADPHEVVAV